VILFGSNYPFATIFIPEETKSKWDNHLDDIMVDLVPQVIIEADKNLQYPHQSFMRSAIIKGYMVWENTLPNWGDVIQWDWLPKFVRD
jgi:hypothetical protein